VDQLYILKIMRARSARAYQPTEEWRLGGIHP
jgi:hypothetical protein